MAVNSQPNTTRESFNLLEDTLDSASEIEHFVSTVPHKLTPMGHQKKVFRKKRRRSKNPTKVPSYLSWKRTLRTFVCGMVVLVCISSTMGILWLSSSLRSQIDDLSNRLSSVESGSREVPETLVNLGEKFQDLQANMSNLVGSVNRFKSDLANVTKQIQSLQSRLSAGPDVLSLPKDMRTLQEEVASLGSRLNGLNAQLTDFQESTKKEDEQLSKVMKDLKDDIETVNSTAWEKSVMAPPEAIKALDESIEKHSNQLQKHETLISSLTAEDARLREKVSVCCPMTSNGTNSEATTPPTRPSTTSKG
ncbi:unnamed protein product [Cyprideis torosa]|uniref:Uncharacterized protein n=1 Tax=Cyprideis torosa TaxID=163714 RepID=A0A7R8WHE1_9CRUS|nr:unnamed protein product [Cyprideis torosa]CAG0899301.1 unnamed protein product [Cyprideis torosa]